MKETKMSIEKLRRNTSQAKFVFLFPFFLLCLYYNIDFCNCQDKNKTYYVSTHKKKEKGIFPFSPIKLHIDFVFRYIVRGLHGIIAKFCGIVNSCPDMAVSFYLARPLNFYLGAFKFAFLNKLTTKSTCLIC